jgi:translocation and assembly module TamA
MLDTGPRAVIGSGVEEQDVMGRDILQPVPRFSEGQYYDAWLLEQFRLDLWRLGYFEYVDVIEERRLEDSPPRVNLVVRASARTRNTYQGSVGYGTDTGIRAQVNWTRHLISDRGDRLEMALGWQQEFNQYSFRTNYRLPRRSKARDFWIADLLANRENQDVRVKVGDVGDDYIQLTNGTVEDYSLRFGRLIIRGFDRGFEQLFETWYGEYLVESANVSLSGILRQAGRGEPRDAIDDYRTRISSLAFGINWDLPVIRGRGFRTVGHHERAWALVADEAWGSDRDFAQLYLSSSWHRLIGERWKLLLRGEVGYTDADVADVELDLGEQLLQLSLTELPNFYRFKAGGSRSVRGYSFESLSNNGIGSNNIITASAELEMNFLENWSVAAFFDVGNAFNDWDDVDLVKGAGAGIRWYSIAGALRLDVAQALDIDGNPWRIHFTVGTPLL